MMATNYKAMFEATRQAFLSQGTPPSFHELKHLERLAELAGETVAQSPYVPAEPQAAKPVKPRVEKGSLRERQTLPCIHFGGPTGEVRNCEVCGGGKNVAVHACALPSRGTCAGTRRLAHKDEKGKHVERNYFLTCPDYKSQPDPTEQASPFLPPLVQSPRTPSLSSTVEILPGILDPLPDPERKQQSGWSHLADVKQAHSLAFLDMVGRDLSEPVKAEGDGVVYVGGGAYWPMIAVGIKMLREVGSALPIQVWHRGEHEPINLRDIAGICGVTIHDASAVTPAPRIVRGWETKGIALTHCGLRRVLYLDADAYVVRDPAPLLDLIDTEHRFAWWQDMPHTVNNLKWDKYGLARSSLPPIQGGQLLINRVTFWKELVLMHWLCQHSDYFFAHSYGDQDQWRAALAGTRGTNLSLGVAPWVFPAFVCGYQNEPYIIHRCRGKWWGNRKDRPEYKLPGEKKAWSFLQEVVDPTKSVSHTLAPHNKSAAQPIISLPRGNGHVAPRVNIPPLVNSDEKAHLLTLALESAAERWDKLTAAQKDEAQRQQIMLTAHLAKLLANPAKEGAI